MLLYLVYATLSLLRYINTTYLPLCRPSHDIERFEMRTFTGIYIPLLGACSAIYIGRGVIAHARHCWSGTATSPEKVERSRFVAKPTTVVVR